MPSTGVQAPVVVSFQGAWAHALRLGMHPNICKGLRNLRRRRYQVGNTWDEKKNQVLHSSKF
jgi:hypothetical protein